MDTKVKDSIRSQLEVSTGIVTYKSLCVSLGWDSEQSKKNLGLYSQSEKNLSRTFCFSGLSRKNGSPMEWVVSLATSTKALPSSVAFIHTPNTFIYSLHKANKLSATALANFDSDLDTDPAKHKQLVNIAWNPPSYSQTNVQKTPPPPKPEVEVQKIPQKRLSEPVKHLPAKRPCRSKVPAKSQKKERTQSSIAFKPSLPATLSEQTEQPDPFADSDEQSSEEEIALAASSSLKKRQRLYFSSDDEAGEVKEAELDSKKSPTKDAKESLAQAPAHSSKSPGTRTKIAKQPSPKVDKVMHNIPKKSPKKKSNNAPSSNAIQRQRVLKTFKDDDGFLITEKVWEGCPLEGQSERAASQATESKPAPEKSPVKPVANSKTSAKGHSSGAPKQATLMKFFKR